MPEFTEVATHSVEHVPDVRDEGQVKGAWSEGGAVPGHYGECLLLGVVGEVEGEGEGGARLHVQLLPHQLAHQDHTHISAALSRTHYY